MAIAVLHAPPATADGRHDIVCKTFERTRPRPVAVAAECRDHIFAFQILVNILLQNFMLENHNRLAFGQQRKILLQPAQLDVVIVIGIGAFRLLLLAVQSNEMNVRPVERIDRRAVAVVKDAFRVKIVIWMADGMTRIRKFMVSTHMEYRIFQAIFADEITVVLLDGVENGFRVGA